MFVSNFMQLLFYFCSDTIFFVEIQKVYDQGHNNFKNILPFSNKIFEHGSMVILFTKMTLWLWTYWCWNNTHNIIKQYTTCACLIHFCRWNSMLTFSVFFFSPLLNWKSRLIWRKFLMCLFYSIVDVGL